MVVTTFRTGLTFASGAGAETSDVGVETSGVGAESPDVQANAIRSRGSISIGA